MGPDASAPADGRRGRRRTADEACGAADTRPIDATTAGLRATHADLQPDQVTDHHVHVAGHLELIRRQGRLTFATLRDSTGSIQLFVDTGLLGADRHHAFDDLERGDRVCCAGTVMTTRRGELSVRVEEFALLPAEVETHPVTVPAEPCADGGSPVPTSVVALPAMAPSTQAINPPDPRPDLHPRAVTAVAALTALCGVLQLLSTIPFVHARFGARDAAIGPLWVPIVGHVVSVIVGLLLILLADQLGRRKHAAWRLAVVLFAVGALAHVLKGPHPIALAFCVAMLIALIAYRRSFRAPVDPPSLLRLVRFVPLYLVAVLLFGGVALWAERTRVTPALDPVGVLQTVLGGLVGLDGPYTYWSRFFAVYFPTALLALGVAGLVVLAVLLFRPLTARTAHTEGDWERATRLVHTYGWDTLAYFALRDDKNFFFSRDGEAFLAYTYLGGYALVSGDPIGARESVVAVLDEFLEMCEERAWTPALLAAREASMPLYASRGFSAFYLGDEAVIDCRRFTLDGPRRKSLRGAVRRVARTHHFQLVAESNAAPALVKQLNAISARWRGKNPERGFTMSLSQDVRGAGANPEFLLCVALRDDGKPSGFLRLVPAYGPSFGYTLDLMRHDPDAPNGMTEFLIASTAGALRDRGVARLSMNFAMWGRLFADDVPFTAAQRAGRRLIGVLNPFFQIKSLHDFNAKFDPEWMPRVLAYRRRRDLPRVGLRYAGAEGFLALPGIGPLLVPRAVGGVGSPSAPAAHRVVGHSTRPRRMPSATAAARSDTPSFS